MSFENVFMIRGGVFGEDFSIKVIMFTMALGLCIYDWRKNKRKDYFWIFFTGAIIWTTTEIILQLLGTRVFQSKFLFGLDVTNALWLTIPLQGASEGAAISIIGIFFGDRIRNKETRKTWSVLYFFFLMIFLLYLLGFLDGYTFLNVPAGDLSIPSRRDMFPLYAIIFTVILVSIATYWLITTDKMTRSRAIVMFGVMLIFATWWTFIQWVSGQRWIEIGTLNFDVTYTNLRRAPPIIEFLALAYDVIVEIALIYVPFIAIPYLLRRFVENSKYLDKKLKDKEKFIDKWMITK